MCCFIHLGPGYCTRDTSFFVTLTLCVLLSVSCCAWIQQLSRLLSNPSLCSIRPRVTHVGTVNMYRCPSLCMFVAHFFCVVIFFPALFERSAKPDKYFALSAGQSIFRLQSLRRGKSTGGFFFTRNGKKKRTANGVSRWPEVESPFGYGSSLT